MTRDEAPALYLQYRPALDGVRALAVVGVLIAHSTPHGEGGVLGVDVFFVLSGFLITGLLHEEQARYARVAFGRFYMRRAWRLVPPLAVCLLLVALLPNVYIHPALDGASSPRWQTELLSGTYLSNFADLFNVNLGYLAHTWSLAIEEQFYLLWPVIFTYLLRRNLTVKVMVPVILLAIALRPSLPVTWLPARADGLLLGALLAILVHDGRAPGFLRSKSAGLIAVAILILDAGALSAVHGRSPWNYLAITVAGLATAVLIGNVVEAPDRPLGRLLATRPLVELGKVSYTVYLLHFPIFQWVAHQRVGLPKTILLDLGLLVPAVALCWLLVERPARRQKAKWSTLPASDAVAELDRAHSITAAPNAKPAAASQLRAKFK